jgi:protein O-GlcNAc transferase
VPKDQLENLISFFNEGRLDEVVALGEVLIDTSEQPFVICDILGITNMRLGRFDRAIEFFTRALQIKPDVAEVQYHLGITLKNLDRRDEAIDCFTKALQIKPDFVEARAAKLHQQAHICDWEAIYADAEAIESLGISGPAVSPFALLSLEDNPARHRIRSERYALEKYGRQGLPSIPRPSVKPDRLRIGYFSADFRHHPLMFLAAKLFEVHDRDRFSVHAYYFGPRNDDAMRTRAKDAFDVFHDVRSLSDKDVANLARKDAIDIAIDLTGHTAHARLGICSYRAAPIQMSYLGYPGTLGAPFIDYIIADKTVVPEEQQMHYSEKVVYLPGSYQVSDNSREISNRPMSRSEMGLPEQGFVFCCFNNSYKITSEEFNIWMRLLQNVEGSVLWLIKPKKLARASLRKEAQERGVDPERLIFADKLSMPEHLARHRLADLFLDTFIYNAHTTASDALWAGLPVVTKIGQGFAARVAGSLLNAIDLPELITNTEEDYERLAFQLATNPGKLRIIRSKLEENRDTSPLFDTELFARHIEDAYQQAYQRYFEGKDADVIAVQG